MVEFVSCSYLGLETYEVLKKAVVDAIVRFGGAGVGCKNAGFRHPTALI